MTITLYSFEDRDGNAVGSYTTQDYREAKWHASQYKLRLIENIYEWTEAVPVPGDDYTESE
jgi:hypothetical protein